MDLWIAAAGPWTMYNYISAPRTNDWHVGKCVIWSLGTFLGRSLCGRINDCCFCFYVLNPVIRVPGLTGGK